jgi:hypothetical protein
LPSPIPYVNDQPSPMKQILRLLLGIIPCLLLSCDYSPSGSHYEEVDPRPVVTGSSITLHEQPDTFYVRGDINLHFKVSLPGRHYYGYQLTLDNQVISRRHTSEIFFEENFLLKSAMYGNGYHTFQILAYANSKTGSLADKKGEEGLVIYRSWVIHIDNSPLNPTLVTNVTPEDGQLKVEWEPFNGGGFDVFELRRNFGNRVDELVATFTDPSITSWKDPQYVGGRVHYYIVRRHKAYSVKGPPTMYEYYYPVVDYKYNKDNSISFAFKSTPFYKNFNGYKITSKEGHQSINPGIKDTLVTWEAPAFGSQYLHITVNPQSNHADGAAFSIGSHTPIEGLGTAWGPNYAGLFLRRPAVDRFYNFYGNKIEVIDGTTLLPLKERMIVYHMHDFSTDLVLPISENGLHLYVLTGEYELLKLNPETLETQETIRLENILPSGSELWDRYRALSIRVSNNNRLMIGLNSISGDQPMVYVVDMNTRKVVGQMETEDYISDPGISPDGRTITFDQKLFIQNSAGKWQQQNVSIPEHTKVQFHPSRSQFMLKSGKTISFYSTVTGALDKTLQLEEDMVYDVDAGSGYLYGLGKEFYIYNLETGQLSRKIKIANPSNVFSTNNFFVFKDRLFTRSRYLKL